MAGKKKAASKAAAKEVTFEEGLAAIEARIAELESGDLSLENSIEAYEKAMGSLKACYALLNQAEGKIAMLTKASQGSTEGGEYDIESGTAGDAHELAVNAAAEVFEDDDEVEDDDSDEDDENEEESGGNLPF